MRVRGWRVLAAAGALLCAAIVSAQPKFPQPESEDYLQIGPPDAEKGRQVLEAFRGSQLPSGTYLEFTLSYMPRRAEARLTAGRLWILAGADGPLTLVDLGGERPLRLLIANGQRPSIWARSDAFGPGAVMLDGARSFERLAGTHFTPFLLQMPFLYWDGARYEGLTRLRGRPAHRYTVDPPLGFPREAAGFERVRFWVDAQFSALHQVAFLGAGDALVGQLSLLELKKVDGQWMLRVADYRDERTGDKTRLQIRRAAFGLSCEPWIFTPESFADNQPETPESRVRTLD